MLDHALHQLVLVDVTHEFEMALLIALVLENLDHMLQLLTLLTLLLYKQALHLLFMFLVRGIIAL